jgi:hypothetical protein
MDSKDTDDPEYTEALAELRKTDEDRLREENERLIEASKAEIDKVLTHMKRSINQKLYRVSPNWWRFEGDE